MNRRRRKILPETLVLRENGGYNITVMHNFEDWDILNVFRRKPKYSLILLMMMTAAPVLTQS